MIVFLIAFSCDAAFIFVEKHLSENLLQQIFIVQVSEVEDCNGGGGGAFGELGGGRAGKLAAR